MFSFFKNAKKNKKLKLSDLTKTSVGKTTKRHWNCEREHEAMVCVRVSQNEYDCVYQLFTAELMIVLLL